MRKPRPSPTAPEAKRPRRNGLKTALLAGSATFVVVVVAGLAAYTQRGTIGTRLAIDYLAKRGVPAVITIDRLDPGGFSGSMKLGPPNDPDLTVDRIEVEFEPIPLFKSGLAAPRLRNMRLVHPRLKGRYDGKKLSFGTLQPLIDEVLAQPLVQPGPSFRIEQGEMRIATNAGPALLTGEAVIDQGRLRRAVGHLAATRLKINPDLTIAISGADIDLQGRADRLTANATVQLASVSGPLSLGASRLGLEASLPYGDQGFARLDGPIAGALTLQTARASGQGVTADRARFSSRISGTASGPMQALALDLTAEATADADQATGPQGAIAARPQAAFKATRLRLSQQGAKFRVSGEGVAVNGAADSAAQTGQLALLKPTFSIGVDGLQAESEGARWSFKGKLAHKTTAARLDQVTPLGRLSLPALAFSESGDIALASDKPMAVALSGSLSTGAGGFDRRTAADLAKGMAAVADEAKIRAALSSFRISAPAWRLAASPAGVEARLDKPLVLTAAGGVSATLATVGGSPLLKTSARGGGSGSLAFRLAGEGLPRLQVSSPRYSLSPDGRFDAELSFDGGVDMAEMRGAGAKGAGRLTAGANGLAFTPRGCLQGQLASFGPASAPSLRDAGASLCAEGGGPLFSVSASGWRANGRLRDGAARLPAAGVSAQAAELGFHLVGRGAEGTGTLTLASLKIVDSQAQKRFQPIAVAGDFILGPQALTGKATVKDATKNAPLAAFDIRQSVSSATGSAEISSDLTFAKGGLQPADLAPMAKGFISDANLKIRFTGQAAWNEKGLTQSGGRLTSVGGAFKSPYGPISGAAADIAISSFMPLVIPPGQTVTANQLTWIAPITDLKARFGMSEAGVSVQEAGATVAHGRVSLEPTIVPLDPKAELKGVLTLAAVDLGELVAGSSLSDSVTVKARINGSLPFSVSPQGVRLTNGVVAAIGAGRLSIKRQALTGAVATADTGAQPNAVQGFAYQALENLAFDALDAKLESRPEGKLGAVFHLIGRNDPPGNPKARISLFDALRGHAFDKPIDLPKGTPVDLTLDTSLNFDELLKAYGEYSRGGSAAVQP